MPLVAVCRLYAHAKQERSRMQAVRYFDVPIVDDSLLGEQAPPNVDGQQHPPQRPSQVQAQAQQRRTISVALEKLSRAVDGTRFNEHTECSICLLDFGEADKVTPLPCDNRHYFHTDCIKTWARTKSHCPLCQKAFTRQQLEDCNRRFSIDFRKRNPQQVEP